MDIDKEELDTFKTLKRAEKGVEPVDFTAIKIRRICRLRMGRHGGAGRRRGGKIPLQRAKNREDNGLNIRLFITGVNRGNRRAKFAKVMAAVSKALRTPVKRASEPGAEPYFIPFGGNFQTVGRVFTRRFYGGFMRRWPPRLTCPGWGLKPRAKPLTTTSRPLPSAHKSLYNNDMLD